MLQIRHLGEINKSPIDAWSFIHFLTGIAAGQVLKFPTYAALVASYEVLEYAHEFPRGSRLFGTKKPESLENIIMDSIAGLLGYVISRKTK